MRVQFLSIIFLVLYGFQTQTFSQGYEWNIRDMAFGQEHDDYRLGQIYFHHLLIDRSEIVVSAMVMKRAL